MGMAGGGGSNAEKNCKNLDKINKHLAPFFY